MSFDYNLNVSNTNQTKLVRRNGIETVEQSTVTDPIKGAAPPSVYDLQTNPASLAS